MVRPALFLTVAATAALATGARAQDIDHAALGALFGEPITTSVTGKPQRASEAPASTIIITADDIRHSPEKDIPGILKAYAGIDVVRWSAAQSDVTVRGGIVPWDPRLLVLVNGRQVYLDHYGMTSWNNLGVQLEEVQQVEVVKGPNGALFGFNAVAGVVNIVTINPLHTNQARAVIERGTDDYLRSSGTAAFQPRPNLGLRLSAGYEQGREFDKTIADPAYAAGRANTTFRRKEIGGEAVLQLSESLTANLSGSHSTRSGYETSPINIEMAKYDTSSIGAGLSQDTDWGMISARVYQNWVDHHLPANGLVMYDHTLTSKVFVAAADAIFSTASRQSVRAGIEYRSNGMRTDIGAGTRYRLYAASAMVEQGLSDRLTFTLAGRVDHLRLARTGSYQGPSVFPASEYDRDITSWSMNSALRMQLSDTSMLRLSGGRGVQAPSLMNFGVITRINSPEEPLPVLLSGNPHIDPIAVWSGEIAYSRKLHGLNAQLDMAAFYSDSRDLFGVSAPPFSPYAPPAYPFVALVQDQIGNMQSYGLEVSLTGTAGPSLRWALNYTWNALTDEIRGNGGGQFAYRYSYGTTTPRHKVNVRLSYEHGPWQASTALSYLSATRQFAPGSPSRLYDVAGHVTLDGKIAFDLGHGATIHAAAENLTDAGRFFNAERRVIAGLSIGFQSAAR